MAAPTWPPTPEDADKATLEEYGDAARAVIAAETDEEAEQALLVHFLMGRVKRQLTDGTDVGLPLESLRRPLAAWVRMVSGLDVAIAVSDPACTDTRDIYLPRAAPPPEHPEEDALLFRCMALVQAGFLELDLLHNESFLAEIHGDWVYRNAWHLLATRLVMRLWSDRYPGVAQDFDALRFLDKAGIMRINLTEVPRRGMPGAFLPLYHGLVTTPGDEPPRTAESRPAWDAIAAVDGIDLSTAVGRAGAPLVLSGQARRLREHFRRLRLGPPPLPYFAGVIRPEWILDDLQRDLAYETEWKKGNKPLRQLLRAMKNKGRPPLPGGLARAMRPGRVPPPIPGVGDLHDVVTNEVQARPEDDGSREYDEWNHERAHYVVAATRVFEEPSSSGPLESYERIVTANRAQIDRIRRQFASLRLEERWVHGLPDGTEIDMNRAVAGMADIAAGFTPRVDWYVRFQRQRKDVAIMVLVDLSGSTRGRIIYSEQEALVLFSEGLRVLQFPHAFYGFNGEGPRSCRMSRIKGWEEPYDDAVRKRLGNLRPSGATRLGAFIRHATWHLQQRPEDRRILMVLSDGRPEDRGQYRGSYGVKDTAMAVHEARRAGIHVHCISLDSKVAQAIRHGESDEAEAYLREIFGAGRYLVCDEVDDLPIRLPEVFRGLVR
ncbi:MAG: hypothetical protein D6798_09440 [Deltaproteobacteria bacterium]|nr:MAG: hypothetical protein D6798_09440 [Deltaproteobacteria bacterium]